MDRVIVRGVEDRCSEDQRGAAGVVRLLGNSRTPLVNEVAELGHLGGVGRVLPVEVEAVEVVFPRQRYRRLDEGLAAVPVTRHGDVIGLVRFTATDRDEGLDRRVSFLHC